MNSEIAFRMQLKPGCAAEYERRHNEIWPDLRQLLVDSGIRDYSIFLDDETLALFAVMHVRPDSDRKALAGQPLMGSWWNYMANLMEVRSDNRPIEWPLRRVFHLP